MKKISLLLSHLFLILSAQAQWVNDTNVRNVICNFAGYQYQPRICSDGNHGAIMCWSDQRNNHNEIYAQHIDSAGYIQWATNGIPISDLAGGGFSLSEITHDGAGGAYIVYSKDSAFSLTHTFVSRVRSNGTLAWPNPVAIDVIRDSRNPKITSDGNGGAIINWDAYPGPGIFVQWIDSTGTKHLPTNGLLVTNLIYTHYHSHLAYSGDSTAYVTYYDNDTLRLIRFDSTGAFSWPNPVTLSNTFDMYENDYSLVCDAAHNAVVFWKDVRTVSPGIYAQRVSTNGNKMWTSGGKAIDTTITATINMISSSGDGNNGTFVAYGGVHTYVQHLNQNGQATVNPSLTMCSTGNQTFPVILKDGSNGAVIVWQDIRGDMGVYAQRINASCTTQWRNCGVPVYSGQNGGSLNDLHAVSNNNGTGIAVFLHQGDIYCSKVENNITTGWNDLEKENDLTVYPNPASDDITIQLRDNHNPFLIRLFDLAGKLMEEKKSEGFSSVMNVKNFSTGIYFLEIVSGENSWTKKLIIQ